MNINLRFGMHRDIPLIHAEAEKIDGLVIPAHILAYQSASTSVFVASMPDHDYIIDPMTFMFQRQKGEYINDSGELKPSVRRMCEEYSNSLVTTVEGLSQNERMSPARFQSANALSQCIVSFQQRVINEKATASKAAKYIARYSRQRPTEPRIVVAPYFKFETVGDEWYQFSLQCGRETQRILNGNSVGVVICCSANTLNVDSTSQIGTDYRGFNHILIWIDDFDEVGVNDENIIEVRRLISVLSQGETEIEALYGGHLLMLMRHEGLGGISHGILYTQHKSSDVLPGGGGVPERYYIPQFRGFRSLSQTDLILHQHPELMCNCEVCADVMKGNPDNIIQFGDEPDLLRRHFMTVRHQEAESMEETERENEIALIREVYQTYDASIKRLPNPDALVSGSRMKGLEYLMTWVQGLESSI